MVYSANTQRGRESARDPSQSKSLMIICSLHHQGHRGTARVHNRHSTLLVCQGEHISASLPATYRSGIEMDKTGPGIVPYPTPLQSRSEAMHYSEITTEEAYIN